MISPYTSSSTVSAVSVVLIPTAPLEATKKRSSGNSFILNLRPFVVVPIPTPLAGKSALVV